MKQRIVVQEPRIGYGHAVLQADVPQVSGDAELVLVPYAEHASINSRYPAPIDPGTGSP